jgi:ribonuclease VapC
MIVDSSALVAIVREEKEHSEFREIILSTPSPMMSAGNYLETCIVIDGEKNATTSQKLDQVIQYFGIEVIAVTEAQAKIARIAYATYGKGSGHPAQLNFGDCFAYALAMDTGQALLFKGDDFAKTDVKSASS